MAKMSFKLPEEMLNKMASLADKSDTGLFSEILKVLPWLLKASLYPYRLMKIAFLWLLNIRAVLPVPIHSLILSNLRKTKR